MTCFNCGRSAPMDAETGYDADDACPACMRDEDAPRVGDTCTVARTPCCITAVLPAGAIEVESTDGSGRAWRLSGLRYPVGGWPVGIVA